MPRDTPTFLAHPPRRTLGDIAAPPGFLLLDGSVPGPWLSDSRPLIAHFAIP